MEAYGIVQRHRTGIGEQWWTPSAEARALEARIAVLETENRQHVDRWVKLCAALVQCRVQRLTKTAVLPVQATPGAAGFDLCSDMAGFCLCPRERAKVRTGIRVAIHPGFEGQVRPRSGLAVKHGVTVLNAPGTIDSDYRGEVVVLLVNLGQEAVMIREGDRVAQLVVAPVARVELVESDVDEHETARGAGGLGSTGR